VAGRNTPEARIVLLWAEGASVTAIVEATCITSQAFDTAPQVAVANDIPYAWPSQSAQIKAVMGSLTRPGSCGHLKVAVNARVSRQWARARSAGGGNAGGGQETLL
jgi:hypothetical protein